jgi:signal transduction histidine kinase
MTTTAKTVAETIESGLDTRAMGNFIVAHDLINEASAISLRAQQDGRSVSRLLALAAMLLADSDMEDLEAIEIDTLLEAHRAALRVSLAPDVDLEMNLLARSHKINANPMLVRAMFGLFAANADDALSEVKDLRGKKFSIETFAVDHEILIRINDNGGGMSEETRQRILAGEKFTTKSAHCGEGMSYMRKVVSKLKGRFDIKSDLGIGTTFRIYLPVAAA